MELVERYLIKMNSGWNIRYISPSDWQWSEEFVWESTSSSACPNPNPSNSSGESIRYTTNGWWS